MKLRKEIWQKVNLEEVCKIDIGKTPSRRNYENFGNGFTWLTISDFNGEKYLFKSKEEITENALQEANHRLIDKGTVLLTFKLTIGKVAITGKSLYTNEAIASLPIIDEQRISPDFLYIVLQVIDYLSKSDKAVKGSTLNKEKLKKITIPLPPIDEQKQITSLFQSIDTTIDQVETQEENIKSLQKILIKGLLEKKPQFGNLLRENNISKIKFGEVADCIEQHDKEKDGVTRFVGLENIVSGDFKIRTWGNISDGTTFTKRFKCGDILFGKRRSYLKKVAVADFDGICSGDILVFRTKKEAILPEFLPHYVASEAFIQHAVTNSAGSLSPRTKWKDLREFEFSIPDLKTQGTVSVVLNQIQELLKQFREQNETLKTLKQNLLNEILG